PPAPPVTLDPAHNRLDALLLRWEKEMTSVQTLAAQCVRTDVDKTFQTTTVFEGTARYMKPNLALLYMEKKGNPQVFEKFICSGNVLYEFVPPQKLIRVHELPQPKAGQQAIEDNFLTFLFGLKPEEAKRRYELKLKKEDQWYIYIEILPKLPGDKA